MNIRHIHRFFTANLTAAACMLVLSGCNTIFEDSDCNSSYNLVKLTYDYNMKFADAYGAEVDKVTLSAFDTETGKLVARVEKLSSELTPEHELVLDVPPGDYDLLVWAGDMNESFEISGSVTGSVDKEDFHCRLLCDENRESNTNIDRLYHGLAHVTLPYASPSAPNRVTVNLKKNTNAIRVVLQHLSGEPVIADNFKFTITDGNAWLHYDNTLRDNTALTYLPWYTHSGQVDVNTSPIDPETGLPVTGYPQSRSVLGASLAEFTTSRLFIENNPTLTIYNTLTGLRVLSIPVIDYALLVKGYTNRKMSDQEYLDRQDEYNMTFFLDEDGHWLSSVIIINNWHIIRKEVDVE